MVETAVRTLVMKSIMWESALLLVLRKRLFYRLGNMTQHEQETWNKWTIKFAKFIFWPLDTSELAVSKKIYKAIQWTNIFEKQLITVKFKKSQIQCIVLHMGDTQPYNHKQTKMVEISMTVKYIHQT